jgi:hypothetical protein
MENNKLIRQEREKFASYSEENKEKWINQMSRLHLYDSSLKPGEIYHGIHIKDIIE